MPRTTQRDGFTGTHKWEDNGYALSNWLNSSSSNPRDWHYPVIGHSFKCEGIHATHYVIEENN